LDAKLICAFIKFSFAALRRTRGEKGRSEKGAVVRRSGAVGGGGQVITPTGENTHTHTHTLIYHAYEQFLSSVKATSE